MYYFLLILILILLACKNDVPKYEPVEKRGYNALESYVRTPTDKANAIKNIQEERDKKMLEGLE